MTGTSLTPADRVTALRAGLGVLCAIIVVATLLGALPERSWLLFGLLIPTTALDAVDGWVARRTGSTTARGARWDMEVDAVLLAVLSLAAAQFAPWALGIGAARYLFWLGAKLRPNWGKPLPFSQSRRVIAGFQAVALVIALAPFVPLPLAQAVLAIALALLLFSFGRDILFQERRVEAAETLAP